MNRKSAIIPLLSLCLAAGLSLRAGALEYTIEAPGHPEYGKPTSIEVIHTADGGEQKNEDRSKNAALIPPAFGSPGAYALHTGTYLTPNLAPGGQPATGAAVNGSSAAVVVPGTLVGNGYHGVPVSTGFTEVTEDLYYGGGELAKLKIPAIDLSVKVYQGTDSKALAKGVGHFAETSIWDGNVALAAHNRGTSSYFSQLHTLEIGDEIQYTTKLGTRSYQVTSVEKVSELDRSSLAPSEEDRLTLYTCVRDQRAYRWCVQAVEV